MKVVIMLTAPMYIYIQVSIHDDTMCTSRFNVSAIVFSVYVARVFVFGSSASVRLVPVGNELPISMILMFVMYTNTYPLPDDVHK